MHIWSTVVQKNKAPRIATLHGRNKERMTVVYKRMTVTQANGRNSHFDGGRRELIAGAHNCITVVQS